MSPATRFILSRAVVLSVVVASASPALAYSPLPGEGLSLSAHASYMNYSDYSDYREDWQQFRRESENLPGFSVGIGKALPGVTVGAFVSRSDGREEYDLETRSGQVSETKADQGITSYGIELQSLPLQSGDLSFGPYARLGYHLWDRETTTRAFNIGSSERYRWWSATLGVKACGQFGMLETCIRGGYTRNFSGSGTLRLTANAVGLLDISSEADLDDSSGAELAVTAAYGRLFAELFFQQWIEELEYELGAETSTPFNALHVGQSADQAQLMGVAVGIRF